MSENLLAKIVKIQNEMPKLEKDKVNPHFRSKYVSLGQILTKLRPELRKHKMGFSQVVEFNQDHYVCTTVFFDTEMSDGEELLEFKNSFAVEVKDMQKFGSLMTYAKRYALCGVLGIDGDEDDDGNAVSLLQKKMDNHSPLASEKQKSFLKSLMDNRNMSKPQDWWDKLTVSTAKSCIEKLNGSKL